MFLSANHFDHFLFLLNDHKGTIRFSYGAKNILALTELFFLCHRKKDTKIFSLAFIWIW